MIKVLEDELLCHATQELVEEHPSCSRDPS